MSPKTNKPNKDKTKETKPIVEETKKPESQTPPHFVLEIPPSTMGAKTNFNKEK
jgi:hypothetical protein